MRPPKFRRLRALRRQQVPFKEHKGIHIYLLPNLFTTGNMFFGFLSMLNSLKGNFLDSAKCIIAAAIFDALDGRIARMTKGTSQFGMEYDSLSDLVSFGVAPAILMYEWALNPFNRLGWLACFLFMACGALRLARFNVQATVIEKKYFQGLPIPMGAGVIATSVLAFNEMGWGGAKNPILLVLTIVLGLVMVSTIKYRSFKELDLRKRSSFRTLIIVVGVLVFILLRYELHLFIALVSYVVLGGIYAILKPGAPKTTNIIVADTSQDMIEKSLEDKNPHQAEQRS